MDVTFSDKDLCAKEKINGILVERETGELNYPTFRLWRPGLGSRNLCC